MRGESALIPVNSKPIPVSGISVATRSFVFQKDSAGLGVPRASLGKLDKFSNQTVSHGSARTEIYATLPQTQSMRATGRGIPTPSAGQGQSLGLAGSIHRGAPPAPSYSSGSMGGFSRGGNPGYSGASNSSPSMNSGSMGSGMGSGRSGGAPISAPVASAPVAVHK